MSNGGAGRPFTKCDSDAAEVAKLPHPALDPTASMAGIPQRVLRWYRDTGVHPWMGNRSVAYIYGRCAFQDMADAIATARDPSHRIYLLGWGVDPNTRMSEGTPPLLLRDLLNVVKAQIRGMFWDRPGSEVPITEGNNKPIVTFLNGLPRGAAVLDHKLPFARSVDGKQTGVRGGVHHQKLLVVSGAFGLKQQPDRYIARPIRALA